MKSIIELAREAGFNEAETEILKQEITSFAALVRAEDEALLRQALEALEKSVELIEIAVLFEGDTVRTARKAAAALKQRLGETK